MTDRFKSGQVIPIKEKEKHHCCLHQNLIPLEYVIARVSHPNGYKAEPFYEFAIGLFDVNRIRVKTFLCLDCKQEIVAPNPGTLKKDRL